MPDPMNPSLTDLEAEASGGPRAMRQATPPQAVTDFMTGATLKTAAPGMKEPAREAAAVNLAIKLSRMLAEKVALGSLNTPP